MSKLKSICVLSFKHQDLYIEANELYTGNEIEGYDIFVDNECINLGDMLFNKPTKQECIAYIKDKANESHFEINI